MFNEFLIPKENKLIIDLHNMQVLEAKCYLDSEITTATPNIKIVIIIHGYRKGHNLQEMVRKNFKHKRILHKEYPQNPGITYFYISE